MSAEATEKPKSLFNYVMYYNNNMGQWVHLYWLCSSEMAVLSCLDLADWWMEFKMFDTIATDQLSMAVFDGHSSANTLSCGKQTMWK